MHIENVITQLQSMRLSTMAESFKSRLSSGNNRDLSPEEFFALLVEDELSHTPEFGHSKNQTYFSHVFLEVFLWDQLERSMTGRLSESRCG